MGLNEMDSSNQENYRPHRRAVFNFLELLACVTDPKSTHTYWRGHADEAWALLPKAGRPGAIKDNRNGLGIFHDWNQFADAYDKLPDNEWERMAIAQHHGLATLFLDWTYNPLVALYFAAKEYPDKNGKVFLYGAERFVDSRIAKLNSDWNDSAPIYTPRPVHGRILNQGGVFSYHADPTIPLDSLLTRHRNSHPNSQLSAYTIKAEWKPEIITILNTFCINEAFVYPGLDGFSRHINWSRRAD